MSLVPNPLEQLSLAQLRTRTSLKWRAYPEDVLPLWVAEMDVSLADPVREAVENAVRSGDTGYPAGTGYAEALAAFAAERWGWTGLAVERTVPVADVMTGIVEMLALVTAPGDAVVVNSPVYPPFYGFVTKAGRRIVEAPLGPDGRLDVETLERVFVEQRPPPRTCCATRTTRPAPCTPPPSSAPSRPWPGPTAYGSWPTRSTPRWCWPGPRSSRC